MSLLPSVELAPTCRGANVIARDPLPTGTGSPPNAIPIPLLRWPAGGPADDGTLTANALYDAVGVGTASRGDLAPFTAGCRSANDPSVVPLPNAIDSPSAAAYDPADTATTLHFHPDPWEIGNEPAAWTHFGIPWSTWNTTQRPNATPGTYAVTAWSDAAAMKTVDPAARTIGLSGAGHGAVGETSGIRATVTLNGPLLSVPGVPSMPGLPSGVVPPALGAVGEVGLPIVLALFGMVAPTGLTLPCWATIVPFQGPAPPRAPLWTLALRWLRGRL